jgi:hypothetical protein
MGELITDSDLRIEIIQEEKLLAHGIGSARIEHADVIVVDSGGHLHVSYPPHKY